MSTYNSIAWLPLCAGLTGLGLVLSYLAGRKRGLRSFARGAAWSLLPLAAYLTGSIEMFWKIGTAIGDWAASFVLSPRVWSGIAVAGVAVVLFVASGGRRRRLKRSRADKRAVGENSSKPGAGAGVTAGAAAAGTGLAVADTKPEPVPAGRKAKRAKGSEAGGDDDMSEIEDILRQRGIK
jgi:hypothetical protein